MRWQMGDGMLEVLIAASMLASMGLWVFQGQLKTLQALKQGYQASVVHVQQIQ